MSHAHPFIGIDFGTFKSCMAWVPPGSDAAEIIKNAEGDDTTPSVLYYPPGEPPLVGEAADRMAEDDVEWERVVTGIKRDLLRAAPLWIDRQRIDPVDAVAAILGKLKADAERGVFRGTPVSRLVLTHPALFDTLQRDKLASAARLAGFTEVALLAEPVAAAIAYERWLAQIGEPVNAGDYILVYDFGGGTFDLAVLTREDDGTFREALATEGLHQRGGNDLDMALYGHLEHRAMETHGRGFGLRNEFYLPFLHLCRDLKERLTSLLRVAVSTYLPGVEGAAPVPFRHTIERSEFEALVNDEFIEPTIRLTKSTYARLTSGPEPAANVKLVLIGGATRVPLVERRLAEELPIPAHAWDRRDLAVALGAAHHGNRLWRTPVQAEAPTAPAASEKARVVIEPVQEPPVQETDPVHAAPPDSADTSRPMAVDAGPAAPSQPVDAPAATTIVVDANGAGHAGTIEEALNRAAPGDTILVRKGVYVGSLHIDKPVSIIGDGNPGDAVIRAFGSTAVTIQAETGLLRNLTVQQSGGSDCSGVYVRSGRFVVEDCDFTEAAHTGLVIHKGANPLVRRNRFQGASYNGILIDGAGTVEHNEFSQVGFAGIVVANGGNPVIRHNRIHDVPSQGIVVSGAHGTIEQNHVSGAGECGVWIEEGSGPVLTGNTIQDCGGAGIVLTTRSAGHYEGNDISGCARAGVQISHHSDPTLVRNRIHSGQFVGVFAYDQGRGRLVENDIFANASGGVSITSGSQPSVIGNRIHANRDTGVAIGNAGGVIEENHIHDNLSHGLYIGECSPVVRGNRLSGGPANGAVLSRTGDALLEDNDIHGFGASGVSLQSGSTAVLRGNRIHDCGGAGVDVTDRSRGTIEDNDVYDNGLCGVQISQGSNPVLRQNRIDQKAEAVIVREQGHGLLEGNQITSRTARAMQVEEGSFPTLHDNVISDFAAAVDPRNLASLRGEPVQETVTAWFGKFRERRK